MSKQDERVCYFLNNQSIDFIIGSHGFLQNQHIRYEKDKLADKFSKFIEKSWVNFPFA